MFLKEDLMDIYNRKEDLHPELVPYKCKLASGIPALRHPLIYSLFHTDSQNALVNRQYEERKKILVQAIKEKDFDKFVFIHERPFRLDAFLTILNSHNLNNKKYWELTGSIWSDSENIWQNKSAWKDILSSGRPNREYMMEKEERIEFNSLPEKLTIYRGFIPKKNKDGFSYSLDETKARWFANRWQQKGDVVEKTILKKDAIAYFTGRGEKEIITLK